MDIPTHDELVERIDAFLIRHGIAVTRLGREANGDPNLVPNIRAGRSPSLETLNRLARVMTEHDAALAAAPENDVAPVHADDISTPPPESSPGKSGDFTDLFSADRSVA